MPILKMFIFCVAVTFLTAYGPQPQQNLNTSQPALAALWVDSLENTMEWYSHHLGFELEKPIQDFPNYQLRIAFLQRNDFHLEILEKETSISKNEAGCGDNCFPSGILKIGFQTNNLDSLYSALQQSSRVNFLTSVNELDTPEGMDWWPSHHFMITDPDGNYIQFFQNPTVSPLRPWLMMVVTDSLESARDWYGSTFDMSGLSRVGEKGNYRMILFNEDFVIELYEPQEVLQRSSFDDNPVLGYSKIGFTTTSFEKDIARYRQQQKSFLFEPQSDTTSTWFDRWTILEDPLGNPVQVFGSLR